MCDTKHSRQKTFDILAGFVNITNNNNKGEHDAFVEEVVEYGDENSARISNQDDNKVQVRTN